MKDFGESIIRDLIELKLIENITDIYDLRLEDLTKIKEKRNKEKNTKIGKSTKFEENILKSIENSKNNSLNRVLVSLGIQGVRSKPKQGNSKK